jgi:FtsZ-binding cell division protein ZapB
MEDQLVRLERKVLEAIALIQSLRRENEQLSARGADLDGRLRDLQEERDQLQRELQQAQAAAAAATDFEQKRQRIEEKVAGLLEKLEAMG